MKGGSTNKRIKEGSRKMQEKIPNANKEDWQRGKFSALFRFFQKESPVTSPVSSRLLYYKLLVQLSDAINVKYSCLKVSTVKAKAISTTVFLV